MGVDWSGTEDFDGLTTKRDDKARTEKRWEEEAFTTALEVEKLARHGITVTGLPATAYRMMADYPKALVLCPGASLNDWDGSQRGYQYVLSVNRAVGKCFPHYACILDEYNFHYADDQGLIRNRPCLVQNESGYGSREYRALPLDKSWFKGEVQWEKLTFTTALVLAHHLGCRSVDVVGCDWAGLTDFDGFVPHPNRSVTRWYQEQNTVDSLCAELEAAGTVVRGLPERRILGVA